MYAKIKNQNESYKSRMGAFTRESCSSPVEGLCSAELDTFVRVIFAYKINMMT